MKKRVIPRLKTLALVAHDSCKTILVKWVKENSATLKDFELIATGATGGLVEEALGTKVKRLLGGPFGGDQQLGSLIAEGKIHAVVFFWDPLEQQPHDNDVKALQRLAVLWNIPLACNVASADFMFHSVHMGTEYEIEVPEENQE